jgi:hypothetical protein
VGIAYELTSNLNAFLVSNAAVKINYSREEIDDAIQIIPQGLLQQNGIEAIKPDITPHNTWQFLFWGDNATEVPFDVFAATFYLLSRYEEYVITARDKHGRFESKNSLAYQHNFLQIPLVDVWADALKKLFQSKNNSLQFAHQTAKKVSTIDVDFAFKYSGIGLIKWLVKLAKSAIAVDFNEVITQIKTLFNPSLDPYNTYSFINKNTNSQLIYFILMGNYGGYDKACNNKAIAQTIDIIKTHASTIGIHPSYQSNLIDVYLSEEIKRLNQINPNPITHSRNHFLKLQIPHTYIKLIEAGITDDYTLLYAETIGFRASTCKPFLFFNLQQNNITSLTIHNTCLMDVTLKNYMQLTPKQAMEQIDMLRHEVKKYNGEFITLWHNSSLNCEWEQWKSVYKHCVN